MKPIVIGAGLAGLTVALSLAPMPVIVISSRKLGEECSSAWAQGGIAAAVGKDDSPQLHTVDTLAAGAGLSDPVIVQSVTEDGAQIVESLLAKYVEFDRDDTGQLLLGLEAAHSRRRIVHSSDATGAAIMQALVDAVRITPSITVIEGARATELLRENGHVIGVVIEHNGDIIVLPTHHAVLATGGAGALWQQTSNPLGSWGRGLALAARAGAVLGDLEFMQFHPTCIDIGRDPMPLASEALRGEGCKLIDDKGERFVDELQPRDVVARAIWAQKTSGHKVFLDARKALGHDFAKRFPSIHAVCIAAGIDPATVPIPVAPAAHYHMGGVIVDAFGQTNVRGLWACGEVACTGFHGANRLASNSLLEAVSYGQRVAESIVEYNDRTTVYADKKSILRQQKKSTNVSVIRTIMSRHVGVQRNAAGLQQVIDELGPMAAESDMSLVAYMIALSALRREESRGAHARADFPNTDAKWLKRQRITYDEIQPMFGRRIERRKARK